MHIKSNMLLSPASTNFQNYIFSRMLHERG